MLRAGPSVLTALKAARGLRSGLLTLRPLLLLAVISFTDLSIGQTLAAT